MEWLTEDEEVRTVSYEPVAFLRVLGANARDIPLLPGMVTLGRSNDVDIGLTHRSVSRRHLQLRVEATGVTALDLGSSAGTFVNGVRISAPTRLAIGASIALGQQRIELVPWRHAPGAAFAQPRSEEVTLRSQIGARGLRIGTRTAADLEAAGRASPLAELETHARDQLLGVAERLELEIGHVLLMPGQPHQFLHVVIEGRLQLSLNGRSVGSVGIGESVDLLAVIRGQPCAVEVRADEGTNVMRIPADPFREALARDPASAQLVERPLLWPGAARFRQLLRDYGIDRSCAALLVGAMQLRRSPAGTELVREGASPDALFVVNRGAVTIAKTVEGVAMPLSELREGALFGGAEISLERPYALAYHAPADVELLAIGRDVVLAGLHRAPELSTLLDAFSPARRLAAADAKPESAEQSADEDDPEAPEVGSFRKDGGVKPLRRAKPLVIRQHDAMDCGAACLAMMAQCYGRRLSLAHFRARLHVTRDGASMWSIVRVARQTGFEVVGVQCGLDALKKQRLPAIVLLQYHYVVLYALDNKVALVGDPGGGLLRIPLDQFKKGFSGMVLLMRPTKAFFANPHSRPGWRKYLALRSGLVRPAVEIVLAALLQFVFGLTTPLITQVLFDRVLVNQDEGLLGILTLVMATVAVVGAVVVTLRGYLMTYVANRFDTVFSALVYRHVMRLPLNFFMVRRVGDILTRFREIANIRDFLTGDALQAVIQATSIGIYVAILFVFSTKLGLLAVALAPIVLFASVFTSKRLRRMLQENHGPVARAEGVLVEQLRALETVKSLGAEVAGRWRWEEAFRLGLRNRYKIDKLRVLINMTSVAATQLSQVAMTYVAARMAIDGELTVGAVIAVGLFASQIFGPLQALAGQWIRVQAVANSFARVDDVLTSSPEPNQDAVAPAGARHRLKGDIELRNVWFQYGSDLSPWAVKDVSLTIKRGETVAFVGRSGSGKTTLVQMINLLYRPTRGQILIDGQDISEMPLADLRDSIGMVMQDTNLFAGTVFDNISFGQENAGLELVMAAAKVANAHGFISTMKDGYFTKLNEGGVGLSGGQRQRISLARALYRRPTILVLDEATSALDSESERAIVEAMKVFCRGRTSIIIAHRLSTVLHADRIVLLDKGRVIETGSHRELIARGGAYVKLFGAQLSL